MGGSVSKLIALPPIPQLVRRRARDGRFSSHALVSIVRLTIEDQPNDEYVVSRVESEIPMGLTDSLSHRQYGRVADGDHVSGE